MSTDLQPSALSSHELFEAFRQQLVKDLEQSNFPADFARTLTPDYTAILTAIAQQLDEHTRQTNFNLSQLLYRIDISEAQLRRYLNENPETPYFTTIAELIIKRVLQKVVIRKRYSG